VKYFEKILLKLFEAGGAAASQFITEIDNIYNYLNNILSHPNSYIEYGKGVQNINYFENNSGDIEVYKIEIPSKILEPFTWIENIKMVFTILNYVSPPNNFMLPGEKCEGGSAMSTTIQNYNQETDRARNCSFTFTVLSINKYIDKKLFDNVVFHELNHVKDKYDRMVRQFKDNPNANPNLPAFNINYNYNGLQNIMNNKEVEKRYKYFAFFVYNICVDTEVNAKVGGLYGELQNVNLTRKNYKIVLPKTQTYKDYIKMRDEYLPTILKQDQKFWEMAKIILKKINTPWEQFREWFKNLAEEKLNSYFNKINRTAEYILYKKDLNNIYSEWNSCNFSNLKNKEILNEGEAKIQFNLLYKLLTQPISY